MEPSDGVHLPGRRVPGLPVAAEPVGEAVIKESFMKRVRFAEWQSALVLGELEKLNEKLKGEGR